MTLWNWLTASADQSESASQAAPARSAAAPAAPAPAASASLLAPTASSPTPPSTATPTPRRSSSSPSDAQSSTPWLDACLRLDPTNPLLVASATALSLVAGSRVWHRYGRRIRTADGLGVGEMKGRRGRRLKGYVTSVGDADNFRFWHRPTLRPWARPPTKRADLKNETLHIRLAGVDAPELAHFGNPAQPYADEALDWLSRQLLGRRVRVELHRKDQYGRIVGMCYVRNFPWIRASNVSALMLQAGYATVYEQANAVHAGQLTEFRRLEDRAKRARVGMWRQKQEERESPAEFKRRMKRE
ncbi:hypothetical protein JCM8202_006222 [Rhodotorula sphaerocarpa]